MLVPSEVTHNNIPQALAFLIQEVSQLKQVITRPQVVTEKRAPINIERACEITGLAKPTIYALAPKGEIPNFKKGKRLYFYEDELLKWIESGKRLNQSDIDSGDNSSLLKKKKR